MTPYMPPSQTAPRGWLSSYLLVEWRALSVGVMTMVARAGVLLLLPWPLKCIIDNVIFQRKLSPRLAQFLPDPLHHQLDLLNFLSLAMLSLGLADALLVYCGNRLLLNAGQRVVASIRFDLFAHLQRLSLDFHRRNHGNEIIERLGNDVRQIQDFIAAIGIDLMPHALTLFGMATVMLLIDWHFAIVAVVVAPLLIFIARYYSNRLRNSLRRVREHESALAAQAQEVLRNVQVVQAFVREDYEETRYRASAEKSVAENMAANEIQAQFGPVISLAIAAATGLIAWYGANTVIQGNLTPGELLIFLAYLAAMAAPARQLAKTGRVFGRSIIALERIGECRAERPSVVECVRPLVPTSCSGHLRIKNVSFGYQPDAPILHDISALIEPGATVALVGQTGSGKSTLASLIPRFYNPTQGNIFLDGRDISTLPLAYLRQHIALVSQEPLLFRASIWENIAYGRAGARRADAIAAARAIGVDDVFERLPGGINTQIAEGGKNLSGGQRQCIAVARAMLGVAPIIILDEPSSSLDATTEHRLMRALRQLAVNRTTIVIAHRLTTVMNADLILVLEKGRVIERGRHTELLASGAVYASLWRASREHPERPALRLVNA